MLIQSKKKKCKGTGKAKGFGCKKYKFIHRYGICSKCFGDWLYSDPGKETLQKSIISGKKKANTEAKKELQKKKNEHKSIAKLIQEARTPFQKLIRIRDHGKKCICCDRPLPFNIGDYDAGHCFKAELYTGLIFHPDNVHGQLVHCNKYNNGNENEYKERLPDRIGSEKFNNLLSIKNDLKEYSHSREKLTLMKKHYNSELRLVEKGAKDISDVDFSIGIVFKQ